MPAVLYMRPKTKPVTWAQFCSDYIPFSVGIDGFVSGAPQFDEVSRHVNFNHHEEVSRLETRATCGQVFMAIKQGFFNCFSNDGEPCVNVWANDCDEDVCMSWFLLRYGCVKEVINNPALEQLIVTVDYLDATSGAYPFPAGFKILENIAWMFTPYRQFRLSGEIDKKDELTFTAVVKEVEQRIQKYIHGKGESIPLDTRYEIKGGGPGWVLVQDIGAQARIGMFADGIKAFVSVRQRPDGRYVYTIGRASKFIPFNIPAALERLNKAEGIEETNGGRWGGGDIIAGSPRVEGSALSPEEVTLIINSVAVA